MKTDLNDDFKIDFKTILDFKSVIEKDTVDLEKKFQTISVI